MENQQLALSTPFLMRMKLILFFPNAGTSGSCTSLRNCDIVRNSIFRLIATPDFLLLSSSLHAFLLMISECSPPFILAFLGTAPSSSIHPCIESVSLFAFPLLTPSLNCEGRTD